MQGRQYLLRRLSFARVVTIPSVVEAEKIYQDAALL